MLLRSRRLLCNLLNHRSVSRKTGSGVWSDGALWGDPSSDQYGCWAFFLKTCGERSVLQFVNIVELYIVFAISSYIKVGIYTEKILLILQRLCPLKMHLNTKINTCICTHSYAWSFFFNKIHGDYLKQSWRILIKNVLKLSLIRSAYTHTHTHTNTSAMSQIFLSWSDVGALVDI